MVQEEVLEEVLQTEVADEDVDEVDPRCPGPGCTKAALLPFVIAQCQTIV